MASSPPRPPAQSYDEIVRGTVPDLDSSRRPTKNQEQAAREGYRDMDDGEKLLYARASDALINAGVPLGAVQLEIARDHLTLRGHVTDMETLTRVEQTMLELEGIAAVDNKLVVSVG